MNIKEHIESGHYPTDAKGRALVPTKSGRTLIVCATDKPGPCPIIGWAEGINHSIGYHADSEDLLPPTPRKVKVTGKLKHDGRDFVVWDLHGVPAHEWREGTEIPFVTEYEEPWPKSTASA